MTKKNIIKEFEILSKKLGFKVIYGKGSFNGDSCSIVNNKYIVLNKNKPIEQKIKRFAQILSQQNLTKQDLAPNLLELVNQEKLDI